MYSCKILNQEFLTEVIPSLKASFGRQRISLGIRLESSNVSLRRCFSIPFWHENKRSVSESSKYNQYQWFFDSFYLDSPTLGILISGGRDK